MARIVKKAKERKAELVDIALRLFMEKGYINTSVQDIYSEANGSFGMFYHHFSSKEEIFEAAMDKYTDLFVAGISDILLDEKVPYTKRIEHVLAHWLKMINGRDMVRGTKHDEEVFRILSGKMLSGAISPVKCFIDEGIKQGVVKACNSRSSAIVIVYGIYGMIIQEYNRMGNNENAAQVLSNAPKFIAYILNADSNLFDLSEETPQ